MKNIFLIQISLALFLISGCGFLDTGEPEQQEESALSAAGELSASEESNTGEQIEAQKDEEHKQEIETKEQKIEELIAAQKQEQVPQEQVPQEPVSPVQEPEKQVIVDEVPELPSETAPEVDDEIQPSPEEEATVEEEPGMPLVETVEEVQTETPDQPETEAVGEPEVIVESVPVDELEEEPPEQLQKLIAKTQSFFAEEESEAQPLITELPDQQEEPETMVSEQEVAAAVAEETSPEKESETREPDICTRAPELIDSMRRYLEEIDAIPDPRLRDPKNDMLFPTIYFDFDQSRIKVNYNQQLQRQTPCVLAELEKDDELVVQIEGHADERGNDEYNLALGHRRANAVHSLVKVYVASPSTLRTISYGEEFPAIAESNKEAWAKNRRVVFTLLLKSQ